MALRELYAHHRKTEAMTANILRDRPQVPALQEIAAARAPYWNAVRMALERGWKTRGRQRTLLRAVIGHAVEFETWRSLARNQGLDDIDAVEAMVGLVRAAGLRADRLAADPAAPEG